MADFLKDYEPVEDRVRAFWSEHPGGRINTDMVHVGTDGYIVKASVWRGPNADGLQSIAPDATGYAAEAVTERGVNATSALENCETSAIGRALANLGYAAKGKRPSREEMTKTRRQPADLEPDITRPGAVGMGETGGAGRGSAPAPTSGSETHGEGVIGSTGEDGSTTLLPASVPASPGTSGAPSTGEPPGSSVDEEKKAYFDAFRAGPGLPNALMMAKKLFQTETRRIRNWNDFYALSLDELFEIAKAFEEAKSA